MTLEEETIWRAIQKKDLGAFERYFKENYRFFLMVAYKYLKDAGAAHELVNDVFIKIWEDGASMQIDTSLKSYLHRAVVNRSLNELTRLSVQKKRMATLPLAPMETPEARTLEEDELRERLYRAIDSLPDQCKKVFKMSRFDELSQQEIAEKLGISAYTVKNHLAHALKLLHKVIIFFGVALVPCGHFLVSLVQHGNN
jgi:RNA polymerase sigma-70 factor (family 1)